MLAFISFKFGLYLLGHGSIVLRLHSKWYEEFQNNDCIFCLNFYI